MRRFQARPGAPPAPRVEPGPPLGGAAAAALPPEEIGASRGAARTRDAGGSGSKDAAHRRPDSGPGDGPDGRAGRDVAPDCPRATAAVSRSAGTPPPTGPSSRWPSTSSASCSCGGAGWSTRSRSCANRSRPVEPAAGHPRGAFVEHDLDTRGPRSVGSPPGKQPANMVAGLVTNFIACYPEGMRRVVLLATPSRAMGTLAEAECRRIAAPSLSRRDRRPPRVVRRLRRREDLDGERHREHGLDRQGAPPIVRVHPARGRDERRRHRLNVGAQPYWNTEATMLMHTRGTLVMMPALRDRAHREDRRSNTLERLRRGQPGHRRIRSD